LPGTTGTGSQPFAEMRKILVIFFRLFFAIASAFRLSTFTLIFALHLHFGQTIQRITD
jgi:hypothetical protein